MSEQNSYVPPRVWTWDKELAAPFGGMNRPTAGPRFDRDLPVGRHPIQLYSMGTPNGQKATIMLEELLAAGHAGAEYDAWLIRIMDSDQFGSGFVAVNPNSKIPAMVDHSVDPPRRVFESGSILFYLAEKFGAFLPSDPEQRTETMNWLFWQVGTAPLLGGGFGHFYAYAPEKLEYPINRYAMEVKRQLDVLDRHLAQTEFLAGTQYSIADIAVWPWVAYLLLDGGYSAAEFLDVASYGHAVRWCRQIAERDAVRRGRIVNRTDDGMLLERHDAADIDAVLNAAG